jgi:bacteriorhodopsin
MYAAFANAVTTLVSFAILVSIIAHWACNCDDCAQAYSPMVTVAIDTRYPCEDKHPTIRFLRYAAWCAAASFTTAFFGCYAGVSVPRLNAKAAILSMFAVCALYAAAECPISIVRWLLLAFAVALGIALLFYLAYHFRSQAKEHLPPDLYDTYTLTLRLFAILLVAYIIVWCNAEGGKSITSDQAIIVYTVLDVVTKTLVFWILLKNENVDFPPGKSMPLMQHEGIRDF